MPDDDPEFDTFPASPPFHPPSHLAPKCQAPDNPSATLPSPRLDSDALDIIETTLPAPNPDNENLPQMANKPMIPTTVGPAIYVASDSSTAAAATATVAVAAAMNDDFNSNSDHNVNTNSSSSSNSLLDEPLSTDSLPIPSPPTDITEAQQAFDQVFENLNPIEPAHHDDDGFSDSGYSESLAAPSSSTSMSSSVRDFEFENGRRYHSYRSGHYLLPNDEAEMEREDMKHTTVVVACGNKLFFSPIDTDPPHQMRVLDVGTGTGIWCVEMADQYPSADVIGVDLSPHQPDWVPPNCRFVVDDIESEWLYPENHFDMIHARHMSIAIKDWDHVLLSAKTSLKPGGFLEFCDFTYWPNCDDGTMTPQNAHLNWTYLVTEGMARANVDLHAALTIKDRVTRAGFKNVTEYVIKVPIGQWPKNQLLKKVGMYMHAVLYDGLQGIAMGPLTRGLGWRPEEVELLLPGVRKDISDLSIHTYYSLHVVFGQKGYD